MEAAIKKMDVGIYLRVFTAPKFRKTSLSSPP
jgi:hypothetical protein